MRPNRTYLLPLFLLASTSLLTAQRAARPAHAAHPAPAAQPSASYTWKSAQIVGGGFVDGIVFHPSAPNLRYARTDMGGAYRWDDTAHRWQPILDWVPYKDLNLMGVESIAVDPADPNRVYLACGTYTNPSTPNGAILRSEDRGKTFLRTDVPFKFGGNEDGRGNGERMAVDPQDGRILFLGTRHNGLWQSRDRGASWKQVTSFPNISEPEPVIPEQQPGESGDHYWNRLPSRTDGVVFVLFPPMDPSLPRGLSSQTIYAGVSLMGRENLYVSNDGGTTWNPIHGQPTAYRPLRASMATDGNLYIAYGTAPGPSHMTNGAVWRFNTRTGNWTEITPEKPEGREFGYAAVSVDARHPKTLIASTYGRPGGEELFRSTDAGAHWTPIFGSGGVYDYTAAPYIQPTPIHWLFDVEIDPLNPDHALFTTGYGGWETYDLTATDLSKPTHWSPLAVGIEETVPLDLLSPTEGAHLISAIGDYGGFVHNDLDKPAPEGASAPPRFSNTTSLAMATLHPEQIVRVGNSAEHKDGQTISFTFDAGRTWQPVASVPTPGAHSGSVAVSADGAAWVWTPERESPRLTTDHGNTWNAMEGMPKETRVIADTVDPKLFYAFDFKSRMLYRSVDGGASFNGDKIQLPTGTLTATSRGDDRGGQDRIYSTPGRKGELWFAAFDGLFHAAPLTKADETPAFTQLPGVDEIHAFGFGKPAPGRSYPTIFLVGTVHGQRGIFRSIDEGHAWTRINDDQHQWGLILQITGDPRVFGRVYVGCHGRGVQVGEPAGK